jgi:transposase
MIKINFSEQDLQQIAYFRYNHPSSKIQKRMEVLWLRHLGISRDITAKIAQVHPDTVTKYVKAFSKDGLDELLKLKYKHSPSQLQPYFNTLKEYFTKYLPRSVKEAGLKIKELTQIERKATQVRQLLYQMGFRYLKSKATPAKADPEQQQKFKEEVLKPLLEDAKNKRKQVLFVDAAHFTHCVVLGFLWALAQQIIPSAAGRRRFNVLGAINAINHQFFSICNETYIRSECLCALMTKIRQAYQELPVTLILDNARYQRCSLVLEFAKIINIELVYLPPYSPNLNIIERLWKFVRKQALSDRFFNDFSSFKNAICSCLEGIDTDYKTDMESLMTLNFQKIEKTVN